MNKSIYIVAAHPDDEVLGCGGTIARHTDAGDQVQVLIVAEGATSRQQQPDRNQANMIRLKIRSISPARFSELTILGFLMFYERSI